MMNLPKRVTHALHWLTEILDNEKIPYRLSGGLAAKVYGSPREVNDIDIDVPEKKLKAIATLVEPFIVWGPAHFHDERWDLELMMLKYEGQDIDVCGAEGTKICDARTGIWSNHFSDLKNYEAHVIDGLKIPVIPKRELADYKKLLKGDHQKIDIEAIEKNL